MNEVTENKGASISDFCERSRISIGVNSVSAKDYTEEVQSIAEYLGEQGLTVFEAIKVLDLAKETIHHCTYVYKEYEG
ncbi:hypothetical protein [Chengkuizengella axinellae]|uniref:Uncharacterized protein n=1 Tax=Chengkuizengella axinellae TaxID=3064388 RepID=A0ABT9J837_9BACL|nr:hypothetical protein [Chengkuizengella sp. 2205SS18-9]MDP5277155.1 hypothetical protein [Chengkuizengella sp. 2205SS18-9]